MGMYINCHMLQKLEATIEAVENNEIHLVLMDIMMPEMDGIKATAEIREIRNIPVIMLSADAVTEGWQTAQELKIREYI